MIELVLDFVSANAYLALHPAKELADDLGVELKLTPKRTTSELNFVREPAKEESVGERHQRIRADYSRRDALRYAEAQGLKLLIDGRDANSEIALQGLLAANARGQGFTYAEAVFRRYWAGEIGVDSVADIQSVLETCGLAGFDVDDPRWDLEPLRVDLEEREIVMVPTFWVDGERYLGRQHLPMIRWQLENYQGQGPL